MCGDSVSPGCELPTGISIRGVLTAGVQHCSSPSLGAPCFCGEEGSRESKSQGPPSVHASPSWKLPDECKPSLGRADPLSLFLQQTWARSWVS